MIIVLQFLVLYGIVNFLEWASVFWLMKGIQLRDHYNELQYAPWLDIRNLQENSGQLKGLRSKALWSIIISSYQSIKNKNGWTCTAHMYVCSMAECVAVCMYNICIYVYVYVYVYINIHTYLYICIHICTQEGVEDRARESVCGYKIACKGGCERGEMWEIKEVGEAGEGSANQGVCAGASAWNYVVGVQQRNTLGRRYNLLHTTTPLGRKSKQPELTPRLCLGLFVAFLGFSSDFSIRSMIFLWFFRIFLSFFHDLYLIP